MFRSRRLIIFAFVAFGFVFLVSAAGLVPWTALLPLHAKSSQGPQATIGGDDQTAPSPGTPLATMGIIVSMLGTIATVIFAWRSDLRAATEFHLTITQLKQQIEQIHLLDQANVHQVVPIQTQSGPMVTHAQS